MPSIILPKNKGEDLNDILIKSGKKALSEALNKPIAPEKYKNLCDKENSISPQIKTIPQDIKLSYSIKETNLMANIKQNELMNSRLIERIKAESMSQNIRNTHLDINVIQAGKTPVIPQKEMEKEL